MNGADVEKAYRMSVKRERDRERKWRKSKRYSEIRNTFHFFDFEAAEAALKPWGEYDNVLPELQQRAQAAEAKLNEVLTALTPVE